MKTLLLVAILAIPSAPLLADQSYGNITVTGTASVNDLGVSGLLDIQSDSAYFGAWSNNAAQPGIMATFSGSAASSTFSLISTGSNNTWFWGYPATSGTMNLPAMTLDSSNRLTIYSPSSAGSPPVPMIVLDPMLGTIAFGSQTGGSGVAGWSSDGTNLFNTSGNVGIGTSNPDATLTVNGDFSCDDGSISTDGAGNIQANSFSLSNINIANVITGNNGFGNQILLDDPENGDGIIQFTTKGPWQGSKGSNFYFYDPVDGGTVFIKPSDAGMGRATFMGVISTITYFGSYGDTYGNGADVGFFTRGTGACTPVDERIRIKADTGNVGIDTTTPAYTLDVAGSGRFSGPVYLAPQGDLAMGNFTADPSQSQSGNTQGNQSASMATGAAGASALSGSRAISSGTLNPWTSPSSFMPHGAK